jgi:hypothetical protein
MVPKKGNKINPNLGLHELATSGEGYFQLGPAKQRTEYIRSSLTNLVKNTIERAPMRDGDFHLHRATDLQPGRKKGKHYEEHKWERAMYEAWGPQHKGVGEFVSVCKHIQTYQYPLKSSHKNNRWGKIDLLGIGTDFLPVPIELKKRETNDSPLRMLVEVSAYGFAIQKVWPILKEHWIEALSWCGGSPSQFPATIKKVTLICAAPEEYWCQCLGLLPGRKQGKFPLAAWPSFWKLVDALGQWFDIHFVAVKGTWTNKNKLTIISARVLELRSLTMDPAADRVSLIEACHRTVNHSPSFRR